MTDRHYIYFHIRPDTGDVFYVGKGKSYSRSNPVRRAFVETRRGAAWDAIVKRNNGVFDVHIHEFSCCPKEIIQREIYWIAKFGRKKQGGTLVNLTDGGDGACGYTHTNESKSRMSDAWKRSPERKARLTSQEFKARRLESLRDRPGPMLGKRHSEETKAAYSAARSGAKNSQAKRVVNIETGAVYGCVADAALGEGLVRSTLYNKLSRPARNNTNLRYET